MFGSRVYDSKKGGDIDLYIEVENELENWLKSRSNIAMALLKSLGDRKIDIVLKDAKTNELPIHRIAKKSGIPLN